MAEHTTYTLTEEAARAVSAGLRDLASKLQLHIMSARISEPVLPEELEALALAFERALVPAES